MAKTIQIDQMASEINEILAAYHGVTDEALKAATDKTIKETVDLLKRTSPKNTGDYARDWTSSVNPWLKMRGGYGKIAHVRAPNYRLTHLLEFGHALHQGGRVEAQPHIGPASEEAVEDFYQRLVHNIKEAKV